MTLRRPISPESAADIAENLTTFKPISEVPPPPLLDRIFGVKLIIRGDDWPTYSIDRHAPTWDDTNHFFKTSRDISKSESEKNPLLERGSVLRLNVGTFKEEPIAWLALSSSKRRYSKEAYESPSPHDGEIEESVYQKAFYYRFENGAEPIDVAADGLLSYLNGAYTEQHEYLNKRIGWAKNFDNIVDGHHYHRVLPNIANVLDANQLPDSYDWSATIRY